MVKTIQFEVQQQRHLRQHAEEGVSTQQKETTGSKGGEETHNGSRPKAEVGPGPVASGPD